MTDAQKILIDELEHECIVWTCPNCRCEVVVDIDGVPMILDGEGTGVVEPNHCPECGKAVQDGD